MKRLCRNSAILVISVLGLAQPARSNSQQKSRLLAFAERVAYQYAIEEVYWRHRIWPKENAGPKPSLDELISRSQIEQKVERYLRDSQVLADEWNEPITPEQLQAEMNRMASQSKQPEVLEEIFTALGNDPDRIAECLARPVLSERLAQQLCAHDESLHGAVKRWSKSDLRAYGSAKSVSYTLPEIASPSTNCTPDSWSPGINAAPDAREFHTAVWTGSEMIVWGGLDDVKTGGRYNPTTDSWVATSATNAPSARWDHTAVWTGTEMIIWGGTDSSSNNLNSGGRYNPGTDSWTATGTTNAPSGRNHHTAVWTGTEMIVWGGTGNGGDLNTGGRYNPSTDSWVATSGLNVPVARHSHTAVWTGSEMIVWGGFGNFNPLNSGGRYNPSTDSWVATAISNALAPRFHHTAVWTGTEMIVWGGTIFGTYLNTGGRYNPATNTWVATSITNAPTARADHTAVWTGSEMIIWGGAAVNSGGRYNPSTDSWITTSTTNAPTARADHTAVWTGSEMIIWGGALVNSGGRYNPSTDSWIATSTGDAPSARELHTAVWTGSEMIVWGGHFYDGNENYFNNGGRYNPSTDTWVATSTNNAPAPRKWHTAVWTGSEMVVWGGTGASGDLNDGGRYNPAADAWIATSTGDAPSASELHTAVWTGNEMIVWGGRYYDGNYHVLNSGGRYNPSTDSWIATSTVNAPIARDGHTAVWTGSEMIIWAGEDGSFQHRLNSGGRYDPNTDSWIATTITNAPAVRDGHTAVWTGGEMIIWGGVDASYFNDGGRYNPTTNTWVATSTTSAPVARAAQTSVWTGSEMIVWGGTGIEGVLNSGGRYNPSTDSWIATSSVNVPTARDYHTAVWSGSEMIIWGGNHAAYLNSGSRYCAQPSTPVVQSAVSRKTHGSAGNFDVNLPLTGTPGIECRTGGGTNDYTIVVTFLANVSVNGSPQAAVTLGTGTVGSNGTGNGGIVTISGNVVTIPLTNVFNAQTITVTLNSVNGSTDITIPMSTLIGDTNASRTVNAADVAQTKSRLGQTVNPTNFRSDVNANGSINATDTAIVKQNSGISLPP